LNNISVLLKILNKCHAVKKIVLEFFPKLKISINATNARLFIAKNVLVSHIKAFVKFNKAIFKVLILKNVRIAEYGFKNLLDASIFIANARHVFATNAVINSTETHAEKVTYGECRIK
jgi:hypothetical protein